jgi:hypothetical protein
VERLPAIAAKPAAANAVKAVPRLKTGTDDEWTKF